MDLISFKKEFGELSKENKISFIHYCEKQKSKIEYETIEVLSHDLSVYKSDDWTVGKFPWHKYGPTLIYNYNDEVLVIEIKLCYEKLGSNFNLNIEYGKPDCEYSGEYLCSCPTILEIDDIETFQEILKMDTKAIKNLYIHLNDIFNLEFGSVLTGKNIKQL